MTKTNPNLMALITTAAPPSLNPLLTLTPPRVLKPKCMWIYKTKSGLTPSSTVSQAVIQQNCTLALICLICY